MDTQLPWFKVLELQKLLHHGRLEQLRGVHACASCGFITAVEVAGVDGGDTDVIELCIEALDMRLQTRDDRRLALGATTDGLRAMLRSALRSQCLLHFGGCLLDARNQFAQPSDLVLEQLRLTITRKALRHCDLVLLFDQFFLVLLVRFFGHRRSQPLPLLEHLVGLVLQLPIQLAALLNDWVDLPLVGLSHRLLGGARKEHFLHPFPACSERRDDSCRVLRDKRFPVEIQHHR